MTFANQDAVSSTAGTQRRITAALVDAGIAHQNNDRSTELTDNAKVVLERRYLSRDREGNVLEEPDGMFRRVAINLSQADLSYGASEEDRQATEDEFYGAMRRLEVLPNSPTLMNAGRELQQLSACFVLPVEDALDSIFDKVKQTALIHKSGGGTGFSFSRLRPSGDVVGSTGGIASGPVSFIRAFDTATDVVKQGGTRRGANMAILSVTHPDILTFIHSKEDGVSLINFNISVAVDSDFMQKVKSKEDYDLVNPRTGKITGQLNAAEVFEQLVEMAWKTGDPGLVFLDLINRDNPNPQLGEIESTNPCGEQPLLPYESCNLASINLARMVRYTGQTVSIDWDRLAEVVRTTVHMLDNVIDMNRYPIPEIEEMSKKTRRIGLGVMGFSDLLIQLGVKYDSEEALAVAEQVMGRIKEETDSASGQLAEERGVFPAWEGSIYNRAGTQRKMRNSAPTTIAPTGTISIIAGASSGIEPLFALSYVRNVMDNTRLVEGNPYFEAVAKHEGFYSDQLMEQLAEKGSLSLLSADLGVPAWVQEVFRTSHDISPRWHVRMQAAFQKYTDNSVSKTINFPHTATVQDVAQAYMLAYEEGCKGITVYRDGSKAGQVLSTGETGAAGAKDALSGELIAVGVDTAPYQRPRQRPQSIAGVTERVRTGHGNMYVTINFDEENKPFELFGTLGKAGGCDSAQLEAISRLVSLALRSGIDPKIVIEQLRGITCCPAWDEGTLVRSSPDAVALALERHSGREAKAVEKGEGNGVQMKLMGNAGTNGNGYQPSRKCPDCNTPVIFQEGCLMCVSCGWNKCE
ncbi:MAG: vitamin B12-dependent ribonucleotide reductase [Chloroflexi bacterium]|nr:vitamin B12-dependent ribonucleotide reductase [Chloroflexota bacterium]MCI0784678.1 vitamin B12-dependent ribonucleotide reductase [Chloroflexota bacterium]MCI0791935.1 vitamin B12-dependent ribonucleotide reductase [Chloroflexota bacterium]MCI0797164.1 vitamin B12-dependent ribonucleotide reductase [Chloroflexota bacterium]MCI0823421.1 vitamin B12-dependent ribonucleotide reductase [Chloroflexota bacterium]